MNAKELASKAFWAAKEREPQARRLLCAARREALIARVRAQAAWQRSTVELDIDPTRHDRPGHRRHRRSGHAPRGLHLGPGHCSRRPAAASTCAAGRSASPTASSIRQNSVLNVSGTLDIGPDSILSYGTVVHCAERITLTDIVGIAEYVTLVDSTHFHTDRETRHYDNVRTKPVTIGRNTWLCPKSTVTMGVTIGDYCVIGSGVTVTRDVPDGHLVGQGQTIERRRRLPWDRRRGHHGGLGMNAAPAISVVVPTVDRVALLERCLRGLAGQEGTAFEVIVVGGDDPGIAALIESWKGRLPLRFLRSLRTGRERQAQRRLERRTGAASWPSPTTTASPRPDG